MKQSLIIDFVEFGEYIAEDGISIKPQSRKSKEIITLNGTMHRKGIKKYDIEVTFLDMNDSYYTLLMSHLPDENHTISVTFTDLIQGTSITGDFYVDEPTYTAQKVIGTLQGTPITTISGASITLHQK